MSGRAKEIREAIQWISSSGNTPSAIFVAEVISSTDQDCKVRVGDMELTGVNLLSVVSEGDLLIKPAPGSMVTVIDFSRGAFRDLCVVKVDRPELIRFGHQSLAFELDGKSGKVEVSGNGVSLRSLFESLSGLIKGLKVAVLAPNAPSGTITPDTLALVTEFEMKFKQLLK